MRYFVQPYKQASKGAKVLALALGGKILKIAGSQYQHRPGDVIINWGNGGEAPPSCLNKPEQVRLIANKLSAFGVFQSAGVPVPAFASTQEGVSWDGLTVVRHKLTGHSGEGIELVEKKEDLPPAPLYVQYIRKESEYRVHVGRSSRRRELAGVVGEAGEDDGGASITTIAVQRKGRNASTPDNLVNWKIRNHDNGFVYVRSGFDTPQAVLDAASRAIVASRLDFGAVDIVYNAKEGKAYVLEINTAPGLEGTTISDYATFFKGEK